MHVMMSALEAPVTDRRERYAVLSRPAVWAT